MPLSTLFQTHRRPLTLTLTLTLDKFDLVRQQQWKPSPPLWVFDKNPNRTVGYPLTQCWWIASFHPTQESKTKTKEKMYGNGSTGNSNGYHQNEQQQQQSSGEKRGGGRGRRGGRRSREPHGVRVSEHQHHHNNDQKEQKSPPPCTDFDMAYFHSYAHVGIHEEMIKVFPSSFMFYCLLLICS